MNSLHHLEALNPQQREAVEHTEGPLLILAGAGSGKTRVLTYRIAHLIYAKSVLPQHIWAVTFTNKAAQEMKNRVAQLVSLRAGRAVYLSTFHSACLRMLRQHGPALGLKNDFVLYDSDDQLALIKRCVKECLINEELYPPKMLLGRIGRLKHQLIAPDQYRGADFGVDEKLKKVYALYQERLFAQGALDFDDLIWQTTRLLELHPEIRQRYHSQFQYIMIDEYQDTNHAQYQLIRLLTSDRQNLCVVGDDDQSIYAFRGADVRNILEFERDYPNAKVVILGQNYRSTQTILSAASQVIEKNSRRKSKNLFTENGLGEPIVWGKVKDDEEEARFVRQTLSMLHEKEERPLSDFCVLYRTHAQSRMIEEALRNSSFPYVIVGGIRFYERKEIKDLIAYLRLIACPDDAVSFRRVVNLPPRGIGAITIERLEEIAKGLGGSLCDAMASEGLEAGIARKYAPFLQLMRRMTTERNQLSLPSLIRFLIEAIHYFDYLKKEYPDQVDERQENVLEFVHAAEAFDLEWNRREDQGEIGKDQRGCLTAFLDQIALVTNGDESDGNDQKITLMTIHSAKGLEFPVIFLVGMEEGIFPHARSLANAREMEEERRLCYVAITRAKERLYLVSADERRLYGSFQTNAPSRFIKELSANILTKLAR